MQESPEASFYEQDFDDVEATTSFLPRVQSGAAIVYRPWNYSNVDNKDKPQHFRSPSPGAVSTQSNEYRLKMYVGNPEEECCNDEAQHRFHYHGIRKNKNLNARLKILNLRRKVSPMGLPDMEFALTPVPGFQKLGNIYQSTKLVTDQDFIERLKQFN